MSVAAQTLQVSSPAFPEGGEIPVKYTKEGEDASPGLEWSGVPDEAQSLIVICHDPDAPAPDGFTHWLVYDIPPSTTGIAEGKGAQFTEGANDFGETGYGGPFPPGDHGTHRYYFWVGALDTTLDANQGLSRRELLERIEGHVLAEGRTLGTYER